MINAIEDIVRDIITEADDVKKEYDADKGNMMLYGQLLAYAEVLSIMKTSFTGEEKYEKLLGFDIDKKYV